MLSARKLHLVAGFKVYGLDLRKAELDFYMMRYAAVTGISLLITGMGLVSLIKIEVPQYCTSRGAPRGARGASWAGSKRRREVAKSPMGKGQDESAVARPLYIRAGRSSDRVHTAAP